MRFLMDQQSFDEMASRTDHSKDCYALPGRYLHHLYRDGVKYTVARALYTCINEAKENNDNLALVHLQMHLNELQRLAAEAKASGKFTNATFLGEPPPTDDGAAPARENFVPSMPTTIEETGLNRTMLNEMVLRVIYNKSRITGAGLAEHLHLFYAVVEPLLSDLRRAEYIDIVGQKGFGDINFEYALTTRGTQAANEAMMKTQYAGAAPVPLDAYIDSVRVQTIRNVVVTRRTIRTAFADLIISDAILNDVGPAVNSGSSVFLFGYPGNGKTSIAERITRLMGDAIYIPHAIEADGQIIKLFDPIVHELAEVEQASGSMTYDGRWAMIKRPVVITGGELTLAMLDLTYNQAARIYEAPFQMKANGGIFLIDDFGRQLCRPMDLLNRWIVPLEKRFDYLTTVTGKKLEIPFDQLIIFSTNLDPNDIADEAFLRRIKFKINVIDPDEIQWRKIWSLVCKGRKIPYDDKGLDYLVEKWYKPETRPFRMCQPRDILDQMISIGKYNMEKITLNPDLIDAACATYFVSKERQNFGAKIRLE